MGDVVEMPGTSERRERVADVERKRLERESLEWSRRASEIRRRIHERPRPSGPGAKAERILVANALFELSEKVKASGRGGLRRVIDRVSPKAGDGYLYNFMLVPDVSDYHRSKRVARLRKDMRSYLRIAETMAAELGTDSERAIAELFEATSYAGVDQGLSTAFDESTVRIVRALRLITSRVAERCNVAAYFSDMARHNVFATDRHGRQFTDEYNSPFEPDYYSHFAWPRIDLFHRFILEVPVEALAEGERLEANEPKLRVVQRISLVLAPGAGHAQVEPMILVQPAIVVFRHGEYYADSSWNEDGLFDSDIVRTVNEAGEKFAFRLPKGLSHPDFPWRDFPVQDLAEFKPVSPLTINHAFNVVMDARNEHTQDFLTYWSGPTMAPKGTALARLESKILYSSYSNEAVCELEDVLERDSKRRIEVFRKWREDATNRADAAWDVRLAQLDDRDDG